MGRLAKHINDDLASMERGDAAVTESPIGDRGEPRPPAGQANGRILLRLSRIEHADLVREAAEQGVSLNHYLTEIVCGRHRTLASTNRLAEDQERPSSSASRSRRRSPPSSRGR